MNEEIKLRATNYNKTMLDNAYNEHIMHGFSVLELEDMFSNIKIKDFGEYYKIRSHFDRKLEITLNKEGLTYDIQYDGLNRFPYPKNFNDFICDCDRCSIDLYWNVDYLYEKKIKIQSVINRNLIEETVVKMLMIIDKE